jgi:tRNA G10  N-methylase Trm11
MASLFKIDITDKWFFSDIDFPPSRSVFIKFRISAMLVADSVEAIEKGIEANNTAIKNFKFLYVNVDKNEIEYSSWKNIVARICLALKSAENFNEPQNFLGILRLDDKWIFGDCEKNSNEWKYHDYKPNTNSHSLGIRIARSLVNIAVENNLELSIVDPGCGVGTVVIEAASMGLQVRGYDINGKIAASAKENLAFFGVENVIECKDMHEISGRFDVSIVDIPYGLFTSVSLTDQIEIVKTARRISVKSLIVTFEDMEQIIAAVGFTIINRCRVSKGRFTRFIYVCI